MKHSGFVILIIAIIGAVIAVGSIGAVVASSSDKTSPEGNWVLDSDKNITLIIGNGSISGNSGVNNYFGSVTVENGKLTIGPLGSTMMAGPEDAMKAESEFLTALNNASSYKIVDGKLVITDAAGAVILTFSKVTESAGSPVGSWTIAGTDVTLEIAEDGTFSGTAPVNNYFGNWKNENGKLSLSSIGATKMAGPVEEMNKETAFFEALETAAGCKVENGTMTLTDAAGAVILTFVAA